MPFNQTRTIHNKQFAARLGGRWCKGQQLNASSISATDKNLNLYLSLIYNRVVWLGRRITEAGPAASTGLYRAF
jgi:hypothetical protein